mgnify:CR=1 FL=1
MANFKRLRKMTAIEGNGNIISREVPVSSFIRLHVAARGNVRVVQSAEEKVTVETDENLQEYFYVQNSGRTLYVSCESVLRNPVFTRCEITVSLRQIDTLDIRNYGNLACDGPLVLAGPLDIKVQSFGNTRLDIEAPSIKLLNQAVGDVSLKGRCESIQIKNQAQGNFTAKELIARELTIKNMAEGNIELYAEKYIIIGHYGSGTVHYWGDAVMKDVKQYGSGPISHKG